jgi:uncharacterized alpha/beta hydrolase family protein
MKTVIITVVVTLIILAIALIIMVQHKLNKAQSNTAPKQVSRPGYSNQYPNVFVGIGNENASIGWNIAGQPIIGGNPNMVS